MTNPAQSEPELSYAARKELQRNRSRGAQEQRRRIRALTIARKVVPADGLF